MGQVLTGEAPAQILPVDHYLADNSDYEYESSLGSTRFFKVARAKCKEGLAVVKVFVISDPSLPLERHKQLVEEIAMRLKTASNCLPFTKCLQLDRSALLFRQYVKYSLYDRLSTRPFLTSIEKCWIAFQLLCALNQCHKVKVCHGDIKSENVMLTSWNWVLLTDFASFKPAYLPEDNPSDFSYFFDTSRRRTCYIAPERFEKSSTLSAEGDIKLTDDKRGDLNPKMDIFSVGCVITEMFSDTGITPFDLSLLLKYRSGEYSPWKVIDMMKGHQDIKDLANHMMQRNPDHRLSAEEYMVKQRGKAFPDVFYTTMKMYVQQLFIDNNYPPDDKIVLLSRDFDQLLKSLHIKEDKPEANEILVLVVSLVGAVSRNLTFEHHRQLALDLLEKMAHYLTTELMLNRILPLVLHFVHDNYPRVRAKSIRTLSAILAPITEVPESEINIFSEYIFPALQHIVNDEESIVRMEYAQSIATLAQAAFRVLESTHQQRLAEQERWPEDQDKKDNFRKEDSAEKDEEIGAGGGDIPDGFSAFEQSYDTELKALHLAVQEKVVKLLSDTDNTVRMTLVGSGLGQLCHFFGKNKACDILLSHMITFLNDKNDWQLRAAFYTSVVSVAAYVGCQATPILLPLFQQGLSDTEETVIQKTLESLQTMVHLGFMPKLMLFDFITDIVPLLAHPNDWIRQGSAGFVSSVASVLDVADLHVKLVPKVKPFLKTPVLQLRDEMILLNALDEPIPRAVYDFILRSQQVDQIFEMLRAHERARSAHCRAVYPEEHETLTQLYRKLQGLKMRDEDGVKILAMKEFIMKLHHARAGSVEMGAGDGDELTRGGVLDLRRLPPITRRHADLHKKHDAVAEAISLPVRQAAVKKLPKKEVPSVTMNAEWRKMFGADEPDLLSHDPPAKSTLSPPSKAAGDSSDVKRPAISPAVATLIPGTGVGSRETPVPHPHPQQDPSHINKPHPKPAANIRYAQCRYDLRNCVHHQRSQYEAEVMSRDLSEGIMWDTKQPPADWRPKGILVAHLQEHKGAVNRLCVSPDHKFFASCSNDGTVRLWETSRLEGKTAANRSQVTMNKQGGHIKCLTFCGTSLIMAASSNQGSLVVYKLVPSGNFERSVLDYDKENKGSIVDMTYFDTGPQNMLTFATVQGYILGWDLRCNQPAWMLKHDNKMGLITSMAVHQTQSWMVVGTSIGIHNVWDMRFMLPIAAPTIQHQAKKPVYRIVMHPQKPPWFVSSVGWNNEVSVWNVESMMRQEMLWASPKPPLTALDDSGHSVRGLCVEATETHTFAVTGGTDKCVRYWDLKCPAKSFIMSHGADAPPCMVSYRSQLIDGCEVTQEITKERSLRPTGEGATAPSISVHDTPPSGHIDAISDITLCQTSQTLVISAAFNGHIKVWK